MHLLSQVITVYSPDALVPMGLSDTELSTSEDKPDATPTVNNHSLSVHALLVSCADMPERIKGHKFFPQCSIPSIRIFCELLILVTHTILYSIKYWLCGSFTMLVLYLVQVVSSHQCPQQCILTSTINW